MDVAGKRLEAQGLLASRLESPEAVTGRLLAVQAQDHRGARLAIRPRLAAELGHIGASSIDSGLDEGSLVINWLNRGTLHLVRSEDHNWLHGLTAPRQMTSNQTRLRQEGVSEKQADRGVALITRRLGDGPATRFELRELLEVEGVPVAGQALVHILLFASLQGLILRGPTKGGEHAFVLVEDWLDPSPGVDPDVAAAELARRFLAGHGPATDRDLARWAGVTLGLARRGLGSIAAETEESCGLIDLKGRMPTKAKHPVRLLGAFDPILHGWESRDWVMPQEKARKIVTSNGIFRPTILDGNRIIGTWSMPKGEVELSPFVRLDHRLAAALEDEAGRVAGYLAD